MLKMTEKLTFEKIREEIGKLKDNQFIYLQSPYLAGLKKVVGFSDEDILVTRKSKTDRLESWEEEDVHDWQILKPEKKKKKLYLYLFKGSAGYFIRPFENDEGAGQFENNERELIEILTNYPAIEIEE